MAVSISPLPLLNRLLSYVNHVNMRVRAKTVVAISKYVSKMGVDSLKEFGLATLLQVAAELLNDSLLEAPEAARGIINSIYRGFPRDTEKKEEDKDDRILTTETWQDLRSSNLSPISAQSIAKIVSQ